ncbi:MAG: fimbrillin family protein [Porphyromonas somerae]|uniref:fimbrillin family protein n=1 Tax=Porphyromonas somerae TaxID=322095 RepID=UPI0026F1E2AB|nr:fimbrillin family protein [Porphyromonas somerae]MDD7557781.1 fimbrillin family protein [Porphyromonas somerae]MDY5814782.1 fimbrillin family protein [Porphyromonas somerae]
MMKTTTKLGSLLLASTLLFSSCQRSGGCGYEVDDPYAKGKGDLRVSSNIVQPGTRVAGETWEVSDAIGIFALKEGQALGANNYTTNAKYTTASAGENVVFTSAMEGINLPSTGNLDLVAYYPYKEGVTTELAFDTSDQSKPALIDLLYSNNQKGINKQNANANLVFSHMLTLIEFNITTDGLEINNGTIALKDVLVDGKMALASGAITTGTKTATPSVAIKAAGTNKYKGTMILPPQALAGKEVTFNINGKPHTANLKLAATETGYKYKVEVTYNKGQLVIVEGATINPWKEGSDNGEVIVIGGEETPTPQPEPNPGAGTEPQPEPQPTEGKLLFPGANFDDFDAFKASLNKFGLATYATQADGGKTGKALHIQGKPKGNDYIFTTTAQTGGPTVGKTISFYLKGTSSKSISMNLTTADNTTYAYNLDTVGEKGHLVGPDDGNIVLQPNAPKESNGKKTVANSYAQGGIDTKGQWIKITLNIEGKSLATTGDLFALKVGGKVDIDLQVDDFTIE